MRHEGCESHFGTSYRKLYGLPPYYYYQRHALRFHAHVRVTLYVIFSVGVPSIARSVTSDAERAHVLWNAAYVAGSRILRHEGPKYGVRLDVPTDAQSATLRLSSMLGIACRVAFCDASNLFSTCIVSLSVHLSRPLSMIVGPFLVVADRCSVHCRTFIGSC